MKKMILTALIAAVLILASSCNGAASDVAKYESSATAFDVLERMMLSANEFEGRDDAEYLEDGLVYRADAAADDGMLSDGQKAYFYSTSEGDPDFTAVADYALWTTTASASTEMGVFKANDREGTGVIVEFVNERISTLRQNAVGYNAEEQLKAEKALVTVKGLYVVYIVTDINDELEAQADAAILEKAAANAK